MVPVRADRGSHSPPILTLLDLGERYRGAFEYDWRARFHLRFDLLDDGPRAMGWGEAWRIVHVLANDPSSQLAAAVNEWDYPASREVAVLADLYDAFVMANTRRGRQPKPYPRPWPDKSKSRPRPTVTPEVAIAALRAAGHTAALPARHQHYEAAS